MKPAALLCLLLLPAPAFAQTLAPVPCSLLPAPCSLLPFAQTLLPPPLFPPAAPRSIKLGTNEVVPGKLLQFIAPLTVNAKWWVAQTKRKADTAKGGLVVPEGFDPTKACPLLIISVPSSASALAGIRSYTNLALSQGWAVLAADGPIGSTVEEDTIAWSWAMLSSVLEYLARTWPAARQCPVVCAGFSGGAKRSGCIAAAMTKDNYRVIGIFMGGCNQDFASLGLQLYHPGDRFKQVPIFLSAGTIDPIASPEHARAVKQSMDRTGFKRVRLVEYEGGHRLDEEALKVALEWFLPRQANGR